MKYKAPVTEKGQLYWIPVVCRDKSFLVGYLEGTSFTEMMTMDVLESMDITLELDKELCIDSSRFNDIMEDGRREHDLTVDEKQQMLVDMFKDRVEHLKDSHPDNKVNYSDVLNLECSCGYGFYSWENTTDIPDKQFNCVHCNRVLIDYTGHYDDEFEFDEGENNDN